MIDQPSCPIVELRQYTLHDGRRDELIELFEREFVESQEATGITLVGQFRDLDDPNRFVWLRGFTDPARRAEALGEFYGGAVWRKYRDQANATMVDSDDVFLLRPVDGQSRFPAPAAVRPPAGHRDTPPSVVTATICHRAEPFDDTFTDLFHRRIRPALVETGATPFGWLSTEYGENTFPALPVRTDENVFVWFSRFADAAQLDDHLGRLAASPRWRDEVAPELSARLTGTLRRLRLAPTARSVLR